MIDGASESNVRRFPRFLDPWRELNGEEFTPTKFINQNEGIEFVIAAQWLFCPNFIDYRGAIIASDNSPELLKVDSDALDNWFIQLDGDISRVEAIGNLTTLPDVFINCDTEPYEEDLSQLAYSIAECWRGLLKLRFPDREFVVEVFDDWDEPYDPKITFYTARPESDSAPETTTTTVHMLPPGGFAKLGNARCSVHIDLPPSLHEHFAALAPGTPRIIDVRSISELDSLRDAITGGATGLSDAITRTPTSTIMFTSFEQLWTKHRPVAEQLLAELPTGLANAAAQGHSKHVALTDLTTPTVDTVTEHLRAHPPAETPLPIYHYPPAV